MSDISKINMDRIEGLLLKFEEISNKLNSMKYVVETGQSEDGLQWYRKWSDGWIEQGGFCQVARDTTTDISLLIPFTTLNYNVIITALGGSRPNGQYLNGNSLYDKNYNFFTIYTYDYTFDRNWYACGY